MAAHTPAKRTTQATVLTLIETAKLSGTRQELGDSEIPGLRIRAFASGQITWSLVYRTPGAGRAVAPKRHTIGNQLTHSLKEARGEALRLLSGVARGEDPVEAKKKALVEAASASVTAGDRITVRQLCDRWIDAHRVEWSPKYTSDTESYRDRFLALEWGALAAADLTKRDVTTLLDRLKAEGHNATCVRVQALLSAMYRWANEEDLPGLEDIDPTRRLKRRGAVVVRSRVLSDDEIRALWSFLTGFRENPAWCLKLALLTGQRIGVITTGLRPDRLKNTLEGVVWDLPGSETKNSLPTSVPLVGLAAELVRQRLCLLGTEGQRGGRAWEQPLSGLRRRCVSTVWCMGRGEAFADVRVHDLRRTCGTGLASLGVSSYGRALVLDHQSVLKASVTDRVYNQHIYTKEKREALRLWDAKVQSILGAKVQSILGPLITA
jgi:integrase